MGVSVWAERGRLFVLAMGPGAQRPRTHNREAQVWSNAALASDGATGVRTCMPQQNLTFCGLKPWSPIKNASQQELEELDASAKQAVLAAAAAALRVHARVRTAACWSGVRGLGHAVQRRPLLCGRSAGERRCQPRSLADPRAARARFSVELLAEPASVPLLLGLACVLRGLRSAQGVWRSPAHPLSRPDDRHTG
jgi:hypothetical protein